MEYISSNVKFLRLREILIWKIKIRKSKIRKINLILITFDSGNWI